MAACLPACSASSTGIIEGTSLLGEPLYRIAPDAEVLEDRMRRADEARRAHEADPHDEAALIWYGRRLAYLGEYGAAIDVFTRGLEQHPESARLLRHRGHRFVTLRRLDDARRDLRQAAHHVAGQPDEVEPDGLPNAAGIPTSTLQTNIFYHLALAEYLDGRFAHAADAWRHCLERADNDDMRVAASYWLYLAERRHGDDEAAANVLSAVSADMTILENHAYHQLLMLFRGDVGLSSLVSHEAVGSAAIGDATTGYGIGAFHFLNGRKNDARAQWRMVNEGTAWAAFGYIAAEAELSRRSR